MNTTEAIIFLLQDALRSAQSTINFLHNCLTDPAHCKYVYPEHTMKIIKELEHFATPDPTLRL